MGLGEAWFTDTVQVLEALLASVAGVHEIPNEADAVRLKVTVLAAVPVPAVTVAL